MTGNHPEPKWIQSFHDGELTGQKLKWVEDHLSTCESCQAELENLGNLSALLMDFTKPAEYSPPEVFDAQLGLRLPRVPERPPVQQAIRYGWRVAPVGILGFWAFLQAALIVTGLISQLLRFLPDSRIFLSLPLQDQSTPATGIYQLIGSILPDFKFLGVNMILTTESLGWALTLNLGLMTIIGLFYLSWLASWWVNTQNSQRTLPSNGH